MLQSSRDFLVEKKGGEKGKEKEERYRGILKVPRYVYNDDEGNSYDVRYSFRLLRNEALIHEQLINTSAIFETFFFYRESVPCRVKD